MDNQATTPELGAKRTVFVHQKLRAYQHALAFYRVVKTIRKTLPRGLGPIGDQLSRASQSVVLNIAEGAASRFPDVKRRHFSIACGSASECSAALDLLEVEEVLTGERLIAARNQLEAAAALTYGLAR